MNVLILDAVESSSGMDKDASKIGALLAFSVTEDIGHGRFSGSD